MREWRPKTDVPGFNNMNINVILLRRIRRRAGKVEIKIQLSSRINRRRRNGASFVNIIWRMALKERDGTVARQEFIV